MSVVDNMHKELRDWFQQAEGKCYSTRHRTKTSAAVGEPAHDKFCEIRGSCHNWITC